MELKSYKTSTKRLGTKIRNQKNKDRSWNTNNKKGTSCNFKERREKIKK